MTSSCVFTEINEFSISRLLPNAPVKTKHSESIELQLGLCTY